MGFYKDYVMGNPFSLKELNVHYFGTHNSEPDFTYGPSVRDHYVFNLVHEGRGTYITDSVEYEVQEHTIFVFLPGHNIKLTADYQNPFKYLWIAIDGSVVDRLAYLLDLFKRPIITNICYDELLPLFKDFFNYTQPNILTNTLKHNSICNEVLYSILQSNLSSPVDFPLMHDELPSFQHAYRAVAIIKERFTDPSLSVSSIVEEMNIDRSYFSKIFKKHVGISPTEFIISLRLEHAYSQILQTNLPIKSIAISCGFNDPYYFSRIFSKRYGFYPSRLRVDLNKK